MEPDDKIIQIIPAPTNLCAVYSQGDGSQYVAPVICLGLTNNGDVWPLDMSFVFGNYFIASNMPNFEKLTWKDK